MIKHKNNENDINYNLNLNVKCVLPSDHRDLFYKRLAKN